MSETITAAEMAYIATVPGCGCLVACTVDDPKHTRETAKEIASWVRDGLTISRHTVEEVRAMPFRRCTHRVKGKRGQPGLFGPAMESAHA